MASPWASPKYGTERASFPRNLKDGDNVLRIVPPILTQETTGKWFIGHAQHYGYATPRGNDPAKKNMNLFYCVEQVKWIQGEKIIVQHCPECDLIAEKTEQYESAKKAKTSDAALAPLLAWQKSHNKDFKYYMNMKEIGGDFATYRIPSKAKKQLDTLLDEYRKRRIPVDGIEADQGLWFNFQKTGKGFTTEYRVSVVTEDIQVGDAVYQQAKPAPLTESDYVQAQTKCNDLSDVGIRSLTLEKVQSLVDSGGEPEVVDAIFATSEKLAARAAQPAQPQNEEPEQDMPEEKIFKQPAAPVATPAPAAVAAAGGAVAEPAPQAEMTPAEMLAEAKRLMAAAKATVAAAAAPVAAAAAVVAGAATPVRAAAPVATPAPVVAAAANAASASQGDFEAMFNA